MYRIAEIRERQNITQEELAKRIGIAPSLLSAYEAGRDILGCKTTLRLAKTLNVSPNCSLDLPEREDIIKTAFGFGVDTSLCGR